MQPQRLGVCAWGEPQLGEPPCVALLPHSLHGVGTMPYDALGCPGQGGPVWLRGTLAGGHPGAAPHPAAAFLGHPWLSGLFKSRNQGTASGVFPLSVSRTSSPLVTSISTAASPRSS